MKKRKLSLTAALLAVILSVVFAGCEGSVKESEKQGADTPISSQQNEKDGPQEKEKDQQKQTGDPQSSLTAGDRKSVSGIYYSSSGETADILILDSSLGSREILLGDEARVFFTDKTMNTLTELEVRDENGKLFAEKAKPAEKIFVKARYEGMSDGSSAEFQVGERGFVVQVAEELTEKLAAENAGELMEITIEQNTVEQANPILVDFK